MQKKIVCFVFNSPVLVPWKVVKQYREDPMEMMERILLWQESCRDGDKGYHFRENEEVVEQNNPTQRMMVRRILRKTETVGDEVKKRLIGIECYWWEEPTDDLLKRLLVMEGRLAQGAYVKEDET